MFLAEHNGKDGKTKYLKTKTNVWKELCWVGAVFVEKEWYYKDSTKLLKLYPKALAHEQPVLLFILRERWIKYLLLCTQNHWHLNPYPVSLGWQDQPLSPSFFILSLSFCHYEGPLVSFSEAIHPTHPSSKLIVPCLLFSNFQLVKEIIYS